MSPTMWRWKSRKLKQMILSQNQKKKKTFIEDSPAGEVKIMRVCSAAWSTFLEFWMNFGLASFECSENWKSEDHILVFFFKKKFENPKPHILMWVRLEVISSISNPCNITFIITCGFYRSAWVPYVIMSVILYTSETLDTFFWLRECKTI